MVLVAGMGTAEDNPPPPVTPPQWQKGLDRYCREEGAVKTGQHRCCQRGGGRARSRCFAAAAPHPAYDRELHNVSLARLGPAMLRTLCGPIRLLSKRWVWGGHP